MKLWNICLDILKRHAKSEEIYMREIGYAGYEFHKMLHDEFYNMLLKKKADIVKRNECSKKEIAELDGDGIGWLLEHIITEDMGNCRERNLSHIFIQ